MGRACRQHEEALEARRPRATLQIVEEGVASPRVAVARVHRDAGHLGAPRRIEGIERRAGDDHPVALDDGEVGRVVLEPIAGAPHEHALGLERPDEREDAAHVLGAGLTNPLEALSRHERAGSVAGEQLAQERSVEAPAHEVCATHAAAAGAHGRTELLAHVDREAAPPREERFGLGDGQLLEGATPSSRKAATLDEADELVGAEGDRRGGRHVVGAAVEHLAGGRVADGPEQDDGVVVEAAAGSRRRRRAAPRPSFRSRPVDDPDGARP